VTVKETFSIILLLDIYWVNLEYVRQTGYLMNSTLSQITKVQEFSQWQGICNRSDISVKTGRIKLWKQIVADFMKTNYLPTHAERLVKNLLGGNTRFGLSLDGLIRRLIPSSQATQKADLAEAVCCLSFEKLFELVVPYYKWANKSHIEMPEHGIDVLAFRFGQNPSEDIAYPTEVKWRKDTVSLLDIIRREKTGVISTLSNLDDLKFCDELNLLLKRIETDSQKSQLCLRVFDFLDRFTTNPKQICNATFFLVDSEVDLDKCVKALSPLKDLARELKSYNHFLDNLELVTRNVFEVINA